MYDHCPRKQEFRRAGVSVTLDYDSDSVKSGCSTTSSQDLSQDSQSRVTSNALTTAGRSTVPVSRTKSWDVQEMPPDSEKAFQIVQPLYRVATTSSEVQSARPGRSTSTTRNETFKQVKGRLQDSITASDSSMKHNADLALKKRLPAPCRGTPALYLPSTSAPPCPRKIVSHSRQQMNCRWPVMCSGTGSDLFSTQPIRGISSRSQTSRNVDQVRDSFLERI